MCVCMHGDASGLHMYVCTWETGGGEYEIKIFQYGKCYISLS